MKPLPTRFSRTRTCFSRGAVAAGVLYLLLLLPDREPPPATDANQAPFAWNRDAFWSSLERQFLEARSTGCQGLAGRMESSVGRLERAIDLAGAERMNPGDSRFGLLETNVFELAPLVAACPEHLAEFMGLFTRLRRALKKQSEHWAINSPEARNTVYRLLYGSRAALEEAMLQASAVAVPALMAGQEERSETPSTNILGVTIHSGDILVSRGGAPTSALIARGNDFPGNFSHIALAHVDEWTREASVIEAHIERGVVVSTVAEYLADKKLRVMLLRLRSDLPQMAADPQLPHKAASGALREAKVRHIAYDFAMDYRDHTKQFCSEVAAAAYERVGVRLWMGISHVSSRGVTSWLSAFGVRHFETQEPSDLEYDPQLCVVAEWRDRDALFRDHADNAVTDALLEDAETGRPLDYPRFMLPFARLAKGYSVMLNSLGRVGPIPEGMSAMAALRHKTFSKRHGAILARLLELAEGFRRQNGYTPPYWELVNLARRATRDGQSSKSKAQSSI